MNVEVSGTDFVSRIDVLLKAMSKTRNDMCRDTGLKQNTVSAWYTRNSIPALDTALTVAHYLNVDVEYLATGQEVAPHYPSKYAQLFTDITGLSDNDLEEITMLVRHKAQKATAEVKGILNA